MSRTTRRQRRNPPASTMRINQKFPVDSVVKVTNPRHWLVDQIGVVRRPSMNIVRAKDHVAAKNRPIDIIVDFHEKREGWVKSTLFGVRKVHTHNCMGSLASDTGYIMEENDLELVESSKRTFI